MEDEKQLKKTEVFLTKNGPIKVAGSFSIVAANGETINNTNHEVYLCACGKSEKKPFCDGSHANGSI